MAAEKENEENNYQNQLAEKRLQVLQEKEPDDSIVIDFEREDPPLVTQEDIDNHKDVIEDFLEELKKKKTVN